MPSFFIKQHEEIQTGHTVGNEGGQAGALGSHIQPPGQNENGVQQNVEQAAAHGAHAGMKSRALRPHQIGHHHIQNGRSRTKIHRPQQIAGSSRCRFRAGAQQSEQRSFEHSTQQGKKQSCTNGAIEDKGRTAVHRLIVLPPQSPAHHAGTAHAEKVVDGIEGQKHRRRQGNGGIFNGLIEHAHKISIGQIVKHHHQRTEYGGHGQLSHRLGNGRLLKQSGLFVVLHEKTHPFQGFTPAPPAKKQDGIFSVPYLFILNGFTLSVKPLNCFASRPVF